MTVAQNKELVRRFVKQVFEERRAESVDGLVAADFVSHTWPSANGDSRAYLRQAAERISTLTGEVCFSVEDLIGEGDRVAARLQVRASLGDGGYEIGEMHIFRVRDGLIVEHWHQYDALGMERQLSDSVGRPGMSASGGASPPK
jgi:predicted ester cyclase